MTRRWALALLVAATCALRPPAPVGRRSRVAPRAAPVTGFVDRIEGDLAVVETPTGPVVLPARGLREGDVLRAGAPDREAARRRARRVRRLRTRLGAEDDLADLELR